MTNSQGVPTVHPPQAPARPLGLWMATALVVGSMIGSGVFLLDADGGAQPGMRVK